MPTKQIYMEDRVKNRSLANTGLKAIEIIIISRFVVFGKPRL
jgi:hypothetical protein